MRYDENGVFVGNSRPMDFGYSMNYVAPWRTEEGYSAYGVGDVHVGDSIEHRGATKRVTAIREASDELYGEGYYALLEDGSQQFCKMYGTPRHSGRYPWGSGDNPYQRNADFLGRVYQYRSEKDENGKPLWTDTQIAKMMEMNTSELRKRISLANAENRNYRYQEYKKLKAKGLSRSAIARRMGENESTLRNWDKMEFEDRMTIPMKNAKVLKERLDEVPYIQVGAGAEYFLNNATETNLKTTLKQLENEGYTIHNVQLDQLGKGKKTTVKVLAKPGVEAKDIYKNLDKIGLPTDIQMKENGEFELTKPPVSVDPKRVMINYAETGGDQKDGLIEVRRGCEDLSLGRNHYVQGRILVDNDHYLKGMIAYADDLPEGIDIRFNTNKHEGTPMINREDKNDSVLKPIKKDQENIFGANIKPDEKLIRVTHDYIDKDGNKQQSAINIVKEEGDVDDWSKTLPSQFLSKQSPKLAEAQLKMHRDIMQTQFDEIKAYTNPVVKAEMLEDFAGRCDRDSVHLAAAALPRQKTKFILPLDNVQDNEAYLPGFRDGEEVALVRFPHAHIAEIPIVKVNNNNKKAMDKYGDALDAVGISHAVAEQLSGADFDGDTVLCIPMDKVNIAHAKPLKGLKGFDPAAQFAGYKGMPEMTDQEKGMQMGKVSNLITDMTIKGANEEELTRAIKHSMVVIDAQKHNYDWRRSELENDIAGLQARYQKAGGGASTFISRSTGEEHIPERTLKAPSFMSDEELKRWKAGENIYRPTGRQLRDPKPYRKLMTPEEKEMWDTGDKEKQKEVRRRFWEDGRMVVKQKTATQEVERGYLYDPYDSPDGTKKGLVSTGKRETTSPIERIYGDHAVALKNMATEARSIARNLEMPKADPEAKVKYRREVEQLDAKLAIARRNQPLERQAHAIMNDKFKKWRENHPDEDMEHQDREKARLLDQARKQVGAKKLQIGSDDNPLTAKEWEAIEARAISPSKLKQILKNTDKTVMKKYALPKETAGLSGPELARAKLYLSRGYTRAEVCDALDISESTLIKAIGKADI